MVGNIILAMIDNFNGVITNSPIKVQIFLSNGDGDWWQDVYTSNTINDGKIRIEKEGLSLKIYPEDAEYFTWTNDEGIGAVKLSKFRIVDNANNLYFPEISKTPITIDHLGYVRITEVSLALQNPQ